MSQPDKASEPWLRPELVAPWWEIAAILFIVLAHSIYNSTWSGLHGSGRYYHYLFITYHSLFRHIAWQCIYLAVLLIILHWRGWKAADFKIRIDGRSTIQGVVLTAISHIAQAAGLFLIFMAIFGLRRLGHSVEIPTSIRLHIHAPTGPLYDLVRFVADVVNSYREELVCMGYAFNQFAAKRGPLLALILMVAIRLSYHTYQGALPLFGHAVFFAIFGLWYWRTRSLWPLIVAHTLYNFLPLSFPGIRPLALHWAEFR